MNIFHTEFIINKRFRQLYIFVISTFFTTPKRPISGVLDILLFLTHKYLWARKKKKGELFDERQLNQFEWFATEREFVCAVFGIRESIEIEF